EDVPPRLQLNGNAPEAPTSGRLPAKAPEVRERGAFGVGAVLVENSTDTDCLLHTSIDLDQRSQAGNRILAPTARFGIAYLDQLPQVFSQFNADCLEAPGQDIGVAVTKPDVLGIVRSGSNVGDIDELQGTGERDFVPLEAAYGLIGEVGRQVIALVKQSPLRRLGKLDVSRLQEKLTDGFLQ